MTLGWSCSAYADVAESTAVQPDATDEIGAGDIVVTARLRDETLIDVPLAISVLGSDDIDRYKAATINQISELTPQVTITRGASGGAANFAIRGIGSSSTDAGIDQSVAINIDGVQISRGTIVQQGMFDIAQVEILKGPQALFFGKNSSAGVLSVKSAGPTSDFQAGISAGYEFNARETFAEAYVSGPLSDSFRARLAGRFNKMSRGWVRNAAMPMANALNPAFPLPGARDPWGPKSEDYIGRLTLVFDPGSDFDATLKLLGNRSRGSGQFSNAEVICAPGVTVPTTTGPAGARPDVGSDCLLNGVRNAQDMPSALALNFPFANGGVPFEKSDNVLGSLTMNYRTDDLTLTSISGFYNLNRRSFDNNVFSSIGPGWGSVNERNKVFTQELRIVSGFDAPVNFTLGGYYENGSRVSRSSNLSPPNYPPFDAVGQAYYAFDRLYDNDMETISAFGQIRWKVTPTVELSGGVRYTHERKTFLGRNPYVNPTQTAFLPASRSISGRFTDDNFSPEVTLSWHPADQMTVYASYKTGFKSGGFSNSTLLTASTADSLRFESESAKGFEGGFKAELLDRSLLVDLSAYRFDFTNLQVSSFIVATGSFIVGNAASARTQGFELNLNWKPLRELRFRGSVAYNDGKFLQYPKAQCYTGQTAAQGCIPRTEIVNGTARTVTGQDLGGRVLPRSPKWSLRAGASYDAELGGGIGLTFDVDVFHTASQFTTELLNPVSFQKGRTLLNAGVRLHDEEAWEVALLGRNLTNVYYADYTMDKPFGGAGQMMAILQRLRSVQLQVSYKFR